MNLESAERGCTAMWIDGSSSSGDFDPAPPPVTASLAVVPAIEFRAGTQRARKEGRAGGHHLGWSPKHYRRSKTGRMLSDYPELDFRAADNSGVRASEVPAGTLDTGVFRCRACGRAFEAIISNRVRMRRDGRRGDRCASCSGWLPTPGNSLADLPEWLRSQLRLPKGTNPGALPIKGGPQRRYWWECPRGHLFLARVGNRVRAHERCETDGTHVCGCPVCGGSRVTPDHNLAYAHPELAARLDRVADANGYRAVDLPPRGGRAKHLFWCGKVGHPVYRTTVSHALLSQWMGCLGCRVDQSRTNREPSRLRASNRRDASRPQRAAVVGSSRW